MDEAIEEGLIERVLAYIQGKKSDAAAQEGRVAARNYLAPERLVAERERLFHQLPVMIAPLSRLAQPGDFVTVDDYGPPLLATRDKEGRTHVFLNVCRHRGTRLVCEESGAGRPSFVCPYHAWSYGSDGRLLGVNQAHSFPQSAPERPGLIELPSAERMGMLWASLDRNFGEVGAAMDEALGDLGPELEALGRAFPWAFEPEAGVWRANWKIFVEGGLETYHFRIAHQDTISPMFLDDFLLHDRFGPHQRFVLPRRSFSSLAGGPRPPGSLRRHANLVYFLFPNLTLLAQSDHFVMVAVYPISVTESRLVVTMMIPGPPEGALSQAHWAKNRKITLHVLGQDFQLGERVQEGLASGALSELRLGCNEVGITEFHRTADARLAQP